MMSYKSRYSAHRVDWEVCSVRAFGVFENQAIKLSNLSYNILKACRPVTAEGTQIYGCCSFFL